MPDGSEKRLGRRIGHGEIHHRPGRDLIWPAPKSVSLAALVGGDHRIVEAHDRAVMSAGGFEKNASETRVHHAATGQRVRTRGQRAVIATFRHEIAHALAGPEARHGPQWKAIARRIGATAKACAPESDESRRTGETAKRKYRTGDAVSFTARGEIRTGVIVRMNRKRAGVRCGDLDRSVPYTRLNAAV